MAFLIELLYFWIKLIFHQTQKRNIRSVHIREFIRATLQSVSRFYADAFCF